MATTWPGTISPRRASPPELPGPAFSQSHSGKLNTRTLTRMGWTWEEEYLFKWDEDGREFYALVLDTWRNGTSYFVQHPDFSTLLGTGGGTPLVQGSAQTGATITTDGWTASSVVLKAGDLVRFGGEAPSYIVTSDASSTATGTCLIELTPPVYSGFSPSDNVAVRVSSTWWKFYAQIVEVEMPSYGPDVFMSMRIRWQESLDNTDVGGA